MNKAKRKKIEELMAANNLDTGFLFTIASGKSLDRYGEVMAGLKRKKWWIFKESDRSYKVRIIYKALVDKGLIDEQ